MSRRILLLSKYPPLEGGIASKTYWLARGLAERGNEVHVVTHGDDAGLEYAIRGGVEPEAPPTLVVHRAETKMPWHIPEDGHQALALLDLTLRVIRHYGIELVDTGYLIPYGIVGHLAKALTGVRHVLRHGGSDIEKFLKAGILGTTLTEAVAGADVIVTEERQRRLFEGVARAVVLQPPYVPDERAFAPRRGPERRERLAVIGKINHYWQHKRLDYAAKVMGHLSDRYQCLIVGQGKGLGDFRAALGDEMVKSLRWRPFVAPWEMPGLLGKLDAIFVLESGLPHPATSSIALEALWTGVGIITDREDFAAAYADVVSVGEDQICVVPSGDSRAAADEVASWLEARSCVRSSPRINFEEYVSKTQEVYGELLAGGDSSARAIL